MSTISRWAPVRSLSTVQEQMNRLFDTTFPGQADHSALASWAPAVDIYETENELVLKADLPEVTEKDLDIRIESNLLTIRGERKFEQKVNENNYVRIERS